MSRILRIINRLNLGGPAYNAAILTKYLAPEFETKLVAGAIDPSEASADFIPKSLGVEPIYISEMQRSINPYRDFQAYKKLRKIIKDFKPDIVHTHASKAGALGRLAAKSCKVPFVLHTFHGHTFHSYFNPLISTLFVSIERYLATHSFMIIAISESQKEELCNRYKICNEEKIKLIPLGFDLDKFQQNRSAKREFFRNQYQIKDDEIAIGIIGRLVPVKNHTLFLKGLKIVLKESNKKIRAFIIGDGESRSHIEQTAKKLGIDFLSTDQSFRVKELTFTSWEKEIDKVILGLDIIVLTSLNEGTPVSLIEAQAANKPIVCSNVGGVADTVLSKETALLFKSNDEYMLSDCLIKLTENETLRQEIGTKGYNFVKEKFGYQRLVEDMQMLYTGLLNNNQLIL